MNMKRASFETSLLAFVFIVIWSSAPVFTKMGLMYTTPFLFLALRVSCASVILAILCFFMHAKWPTSMNAWRRLVIAGFLLQVVYLGASFCAMSLQTPPAIFAIVLGAQPFLTAVICHVIFKDLITKKQWLGLALGFSGLFLATSASLSTKSLSFEGFCFLILALLGFTIGTIYQKRQCGDIDPRTSAASQNLIAIIPLFLLAITFEHPLTVHPTLEFWFAFSWMVILVSAFAFLILAVLIKRGDLTHVASLFYLMPPCTAIMSYFIFGEKLTPATLLSLAIICIGIFLVNHSRRNCIK